MKPKLKSVFFIIIAAAVLIPLLVFGWKELQKQPIDIVMRGAEIKADGTVVQETEFRLKGYLKKHHSQSGLIPFEFYLEPVTFTGLQGPNTDMYGEESYLLLQGDVPAPTFYGSWYTYSAEQNAPVGVTIYLSHDLHCCIIESDGRYFVGSTDEQTDVQKILNMFPQFTPE